MNRTNELLFKFFKVFILIFLICGSTSFAEDLDGTVKPYNVGIYGVLDKVEFLIVPISAALHGGSICGWWCGGIGLVLGVLDEVAVSSGITSRYYLTWAIWGGSAGKKIYPLGAAGNTLVRSDVAGASLVLVVSLLPSSILDKIVDASFYVIKPVISGYAVSKIVPPVLSVTGVPTNYVKPASIIIGIIGGPALNYMVSKGVSNEVSPVTTTEDLYDLYIKFIPKDKLDAHIERQAIVTTDIQVIIYFLISKLYRHSNDLQRGYQALDAVAGKSWNNFKTETMMFIAFLPLYVLGDFISDNINSYYSIDLQYELENRIRSELLGDEIILRLSFDEDALTLTDKMETDIGVIAYDGSSMLADAFSKSINGIYGFGVMATRAPEPLAYNMIYNQFRQLFAHLLENNKRFYDDEITRLETGLSSIKKHDGKYAELIVIRDGQQFTLDELSGFSKDLYIAKSRQKQWKSTSDTYNSITKNLGYISRYFLLGYTIKQGDIIFEERADLEAANNRASNALSWSSDNARKLDIIDQSLDRLKSLEEKIHGEKSVIGDKIAREFGGEEIRLKNLRFGAKSTTFVSIDSLELEMGKIYVVTGAPGCGKSSFLKKLKGVRENGIWGEGIIYYPFVNGEKPKIVMVPQQDYFPLNASLYESILYPDKLSEEVLDEVVDLLKEIGFRDSSCDKALLDGKESWEGVLSGGEKKKIAVVSAIVKRPDILILDEVFNGLGQDATKAQQMLKKYLPASLILVVDHHADNSEGFYDKELHFENNKVTVQDYNHKGLKIINEKNEDKDS